MTDSTNQTQQTQTAELLQVQTVGDVARLMVDLFELNLRVLSAGVHLVNVACLRIDSKLGVINLQEQQQLEAGFGQAVANYNQHLIYVGGALQSLRLQLAPADPVSMTDAIRAARQALAVQPAQSPVSTDQGPDTEPDQQAG